MVVQVYAHPDGSYEWVPGTHSDADMEASNAHPDGPGAWLRENAEILPPPAG